ncbi:MAG: hypothetical protein NTX50_31065 [Candidatus Sumerlaeota bacterium]|nr:hypothetical protein [Candidatus Sumerlaeota bacterium]
MYEIKFTPESRDSLKAPWKKFKVGQDDDISQNKALMRHLAKRRTGGKRISLSEVKKQLELS